MDAINADKMLFANFKEKGHMRNLHIDGRVILALLLKTESVSMYNECS